MFGFLTRVDEVIWPPKGDSSADSFTVAKLPVESVEKTKHSIHQTARKTVSSDFQTPRSELEKRDAAAIFFS